MLSRTIRLFPLVLTLPLSFVVACSGGDEGDDTAPGAGAGGGTGGQSAGGATSTGAGGKGTAGTSHGGTAGSAGHAAAGSGGASGSGGEAGHGGAHAGSGGSVGGSGGSTAGHGGSTGGSGGSTAGHGGTTGGSAGSTAGHGGSTGGSAGTAGTGGAKGCQIDGDCLVPSTVQPPGCAVGKCDTTAHTCSLLGADKDGDGHRTNQCSDKAGATILLGDDCDDSDGATFPKAWDGPKDGTKPDRCDGIDQDCDGKADDGVATGGVTCTCAPGDVQACKEDSSGKPIMFPPGALQGECKFGSKVCLADGTFGPCTDAVGPTPEICDNLDNDCNGVKDDNPSDPVEWVYDGDDDGHAAMGCDPVLSCVQTTPSGLPMNCPAGPNQPGTCGTCTPDKWKHSSAIPADDCNDDDAAEHPGAMEVCDGKDNNCDNQIDEGFQLGAVCDIGAVHVGACLGGGTLACGSDLTAKCFPPAGVTIPGDYSNKTAPNGSWDWNCDGTDSMEYAATVCKKPTESSCDQDEANKCLGLMHPDCGGVFPAGSILAYEQLQVQTKVFCGDGIRIVTCKDAGPTCGISGSPSYTTERCR